MSKPRIRFKGFEQEWESCKLSDLSMRVTRKNTNCQSKRILTISAAYGLVTQDSFFNSLVAGSDISNYYLIQNGEFAYNKSSSQDYPVGAVKRLDSYLNGVLSTLYIVFCLKAEKVDSNYIAALFDSAVWHNEIRNRAAEGARNHGLLNISAHDFFDIRLYLPQTLNEQKFIGDFIDVFSSYISSLQDKITSLKSLKICYLNRLFPIGGGNEPPVRLAGFSGEWIEKKLGDCFEERNERSSEGELLSVTISDGIKRFSELNRRDSSSKDKSNYKVVKKGDIVYNSMRMWQGASGCSEYDGIVSPAYTVLIPKAGINPHFFAFFFKNPALIDKFRIYSQGLTSDTWNLKYPSFSQIAIRYPESMEEQELLSNFLSEVNNLLHFHEEELERLKALKESCLQGMFV